MTVRPFPLVHPKFKLGKRAPIIDPRTLKASAYMKIEELPPAPAFRHWESAVQSWPMYDNDTLGICVPAAAGHVEQAWTFNAGSPFTPPTQIILNAYEKAGGYVPGNPATDQGMFLIDMLKYWHKVGISFNKLAGYMSMTLPTGASQPIPDTRTPWPPTSQGSPTMWDEMKQVVNIFGAAFIGLQLPLTAQNQVGTIFQVPNSGPVGNASPGSWGGHCVPIVGYMPHAAVCVTWGALQLISWAFLFYYMDEAWAPLSPDWINKVKQVAPNGFNWQQLLADQKLVSLKKAA